MAVTAVDVFQVTVQPSTAQITVGGTIQLNATAFDAAGHDLRRNASWASSDATVATVNGSGLVTAVSTGGATVTATVDGKSGQAVLSILPKPVASVSLIPQSASLQAGDSVRLQLVVKATDGSTLTGRTATWASSDTRIVVVRPSGWVVALAAGTAAVSAVVEGFSAQAVISVRASSGVAVARVSVAPATSTLAVGDTLRFRATLTDATGQTLVGRVVTWTSNNTAVATVDGTGLVRALKAGSAIINAFSEGVSGAAQLTVAVPRPVSIEVTPSSSSLTLGSTIQLAASVKASDGSTLSGIPIVWSSLQPSIATVDATGLVTGLSIGAATIRAAAAGLTGTANIVVALQPVAIITLSPAVPAVTVGDTLVLTADLRDANGVPLAGRTVFWTSADPAIATVTGTGPTTPRANLVGVTPGTVDITASAEGKQTTVTATVLPKASLQVTKIATSPVVSASDTIVFQITVTNGGPDDATAMVLTDTLPTNAMFLDATGAPTVSGNVLTWPTVATFAVGATLSDTVRVLAPPTGTVANIAAVVSATAENDSTDNRAVGATGVNDLVDLVVTKSAPLAIDAGDTIAYAVKVKNLGPSAAAAVAVSDTLPGNAKLVSATGGPVQNGNALDWPVVASLPAGDSLLFSVLVEAPTNGSVANTAAAISATNEGVLSNNRAVATTSVLAADLAVTKIGSATANPGDTIVYTVTLANQGPGRAVGVVLRDSLPAGATLVSATGTPTAAGTLLTWPTVAALASGGQVVQTVRVIAPAPGATLTNVALASASTTDPATGDNRATASTTVLAADVAVTKTGPATASAGDTLLYVITVTNTGPSVAAAVTITDTLPANATLLSATGGAVASGGVLTWPVVPTLAPGGAVTDTVRVRGPLAGGTVVNVAAASTTTTDLTIANNRSTISTAVATSTDLAVSKLAPATVVAGRTFVDTVKVKNLGPSAAAGVVVTDTLPANATYQGASGGATLNGSVLTWPTAASLAAGDSLVYTVTLQAPATTATVVNVAAAVTSTPESSTANNTASAGTAVGAAADLAVTKTGPAFVTATDTIPFTVTVKNLGPSTASTIVTTDTLPANTTFIDANPSATPIGGVITWTAVASLVPGDSLVYTVRVLAPSSNATVTNVAAAVSATTDVSTANNRGSATTGVGAAADLEVSKTGPATVDAGAAVQYTVTVRNLGPSAATGVVRTDTLPAGVAFNSATGNPTLSGNVLTWSAVPLPAGDSLKETVSITAPAAGVLTNVARAAASTADPNASNDRSVVVTTVNGADLAVTKTGPATVLPGGAVAYALALTNNGPGPALSVVLTDTLPAGATLDAGQTTPGYTLNGNVLSWQVSSVSPGPALNYTVGVTAPASGTLLNAAAVVASTSDPDASDNYDTVSTSVLQPDLVVSKTGPANANASDTLLYVLTVSNAGTAAAANVVLSDTLPGNAVFVDASGGGTLSAGVVTWPTVASLGVGGSFVDTVRVEAPAAGGTVVNAAAAATTTAESSTANNTAGVTTIVAPPTADLIVTKTGPASAYTGDTVSYSITVLNNGPYPAENVVLTDTLPGNSTFIDATGGPTSASGALTWPTVTSLASGASIVETVRVSPVSASGSITNVARASSTTLDPNTGNNRSVVVSTVSKPPASADLVMSKSGPAAASAGDTLRYVLTVQNNGPDAATDVVVSDTLPGGVTFVDATGGLTPVANVVTWPAVSSLASGAVVVDTVRVLAPSAGGTVANTGAVEASTVDSNPANDASSVTTTVAPSADLVLSFSAAPGTVNVGDTITYTLQVTNNGPSASADVLLSHALPTNVTLVDADGGTLASGTITWPAVASLPSGGSFTHTVKVEANATGAADSSASVSASTADPDASNNAGGATTTVN